MPFIILVRDKAIIITSRLFCSVELDLAGDEHDMMTSVMTQETYSLDIRPR
ncbi:uncharacterized protein LAESUDRAFT_533092 [Laetiporus sulphureus 93-53]|uniref:Uncharacterized protein n=1 Tax=Laetiporus sulphureus 93-53 TaxID=1314785 RepID=A0A165AV68_9APHY|nr:uncharacterized protein LAESUDRAFT_85179 [Laetiporus sulphureus 93-53]XP_040758344.1 uncharacterized protein LAESUDRAFT_533092 [Laetiporus sulphureus 93-53]KZS99726.1 hypothetical protein LAESUDRAFT_85179 [Laetiporus sulphureus 93-53]KZT00604.1 hypothetical protein LAESUDRAFT_533092 [Laetiporus sulphureus 93-53]